MLSFEQKSNWVVRNQGRIAKVQKAIAAIEETIAKTEAHRACLEYNCQRELGLCTGSNAEYMAIFEKHDVEIAKCIDTIGDAITKRSRLGRLATKLRRHEKVIFALPNSLGW